LRRRSRCAGVGSATAAPRPVVAPRHKVRGERRGEEGGGAIAPAGGSEAVVDPQAGGGGGGETEGTAGGEVAGEAGWPAGMVGAAAVCREWGD
jgi:hypothetical protein